MENENAFEKKMARLNNSVITLKNIDDEDFTHSYDGVPYTIRKYEVLPFPYPVGLLLAKHLAMKMLRKEAKKNKDFKSTSDKKNVNLYKPQSLNDLMSKIIVDKQDKPLPAEKSQGEIMKEKTKELQQGVKEKALDESPEVTKNDIIAELEKRGIKFNPRDKKEVLLSLLIEAEQAGNTGEEE